MKQVRVSGYSISSDGFAAGPDQSLSSPLGIGGEELHRWLKSTQTFMRMIGEQGGMTGVDDRHLKAAHDGIGAWIMGRNMFGPVRGEWPDHDWCGWWGPNPPYRTPVYVLTHHSRPSLEMEGGTIFHFVTDGPEAALERARADAGDADVGIAGGAATIRHYLAAEAINELHLAVVPVLLGAGEHLFENLNLPKLNYVIDRCEAGENATHLILRHS
jgi:dihydrofolate reductase